MSDGRSAWAFKFSYPVFIPTLAVSILILVSTILAPDQMGGFFSSVLETVTKRFGWWTMLVSSSVFVFMLFLAFSRWGNIRLGPDHATPEYSLPAWFSMLFASGYGVALVFFGVAEPVLHFASPPTAEPRSAAAAHEAMQIAFFHWGVHVWAIYGIVGVTLAYFAFRHGLPLSMRSAFYPIVGEKIHGPVGYAVDVFAAICTLFGLATTLGVSVIQINAGINHLVPTLPISASVQLMLIFAITCLTLVSVVLGLDRGVRLLSSANLVVAGILMAFVFLVGPTVHILEVFLQNTGAYISGFAERTLYLSAYQNDGWMGEWTLFIFSWIIAWAPFVGLFIARISYGRTIREFVFGVFFIPTLVTFFWFSTFGDTALHMITVGGFVELIDLVQNDASVALFQLLERLPFSAFVIPAVLVLIGIFFVTSADSGALVVDSLTAGGETSRSPLQRGMWAVIGGAVAGGLLAVGGLMALRAMTVASALPFSFVMVASAVGLYRALKVETMRDESLKGRSAVADATPQKDWRKRLARIVEAPTEEDVKAFVAGRCLSALRAIRVEIAEHGFESFVDDSALPEAVCLSVHDENRVHFVYEIRSRAYERGYIAEVFLRRGGQAYDVYGLDEPEIIADVLDQLARYLQFLHSSEENLPWDTREIGEDGLNSSASHH